jgi:translation initiation factor IF-3
MKGPSTGTVTASLEVIIRTSTRVNYRIRVPEVRCISDTGEQIGIIATGEALKLALSNDLDLVEISPNANPPVCRIMNFGKFRYEESRRDKMARKHQVRVELKEMKFHANVEDHDYCTKMHHIRAFLEKGCRVKTSLLFRGRENEHRELGYGVFTRLIKDCADILALIDPVRGGREIDLEILGTLISRADFLKENILQIPDIDAVRDRYQQMTEQEIRRVCEDFVSIL